MPEGTGLGGDGIGIDVTPPDDQFPIIVTPTPVTKPVEGVTAPAPPVTPSPGPGPEVIGPQAPGAAPDIWTVVMLVVALGLLSLMKALTDFFNWLFSLIFGAVLPGKKPPTLSPPQTTQALSNFLGTQVSGIDAAMGSAFTTQAVMVGRVGSLLLLGAETSRQIALRLARIDSASTAGQQDAQAAQHRAQQAQASANAAGALVTTETTRAKHAEAQVQHHVSTVEHSQTHLIEPELDALRSRIPKLEKGLSDAFDLLRQHEEALGIGALTAATAVSLGRLGADWTTCESAQLLGKGVCGAGANNVKNLLEGLLDIAALFDLCTLVELMVDTAESSIVQDAFKTLVLGIDSLIKCRGIKLYQPAAVAAPSLSPSVFAFAELAPVG